MRFISKFVIQRCPMVAMQMAVIWAKRIFLAAVIWAAVLVWAAMSMMDMLQTSADIMHAIWLIGLLLCSAFSMMLVVGTRHQCAYFMAMGLIKSWRRSQVLALSVSMGVFASVLWSIYGLLTWEWGVALYHYIAMVLYSIVSSESVFGQLQTRLLALRESQQYALTLVASGPWVFAAWMLGVLTGEISIIYENALVPLCGLGALCAISIAMNHYGSGVCFDLADQGHDEENGHSNQP